ncbi:ABC transporter substrate-binding protein [Methylocystis sp.]|uniref:ABC transporter substrate-binding protein n=1 Tax=Methylocystis sp. TaxID=1911079 RepID=UPI0027353A12|nr:ABC transporter substrate-binding protein [Methylocystis sp.]MDP3553710.1 ABC transporter substrate-binding protein [Methylocystis sp.]
MSVSTITSGVLCVGAALPDPPFEFMEDGEARGFDIELMQAVAAELGLAWRLAPYTGADFNCIFEGLARGTWDCVASGATITPDRLRLASFCTPYIRSGQSLVCNVEATPSVRSIDDLRGMILGVQQGNTSEPVAHRLKDEGRIAEARTYAYHDIGAMLDDLSAGKIGAVMKLAPVMRWMIRNRPQLRIVQDGITDERLGVAVRLGDDALRTAINDAQARLHKSGALPQLVKKWLQT